MTTSIDAAKSLITSRIISGAPGSVTAAKLQSTLLALADAVATDRVPANIPTSVSSPLSGGDLGAVLTNLALLLDGLAPKDSPELSGTPTAPTAASEVSSTQIATTAFVHNLVNAIVNAAPGALDTLNELAAALGDDANFAATMTAALAEKVAIADIVDDLTTGGAALPLSAEQGKVLKGLCDALVLASSSASMAVSAAAGALTISIKNSSGDDPTGVAPVNFVFRDSTLAVGTPVVRSLEAALSLTLPSTATLGATSGEPLRVWIVAFDNAGTLVLGAINCLTSSGVTPIDESALNSGTAIDTAADNGGVIYSASVVSAKALKIVGYLEWTTLATAGTWVAPDKIKIFGPDTPLPGQPVRSALWQTGASSSGTTTLPIDDTIPQNTEGVQFFSQSYSPASAANWLELEHVGYYSHTSTTAQIFAALFKDSVANAIAVGWAGRAPSANAYFAIQLRHGMRAGGLTSVKVRAGTIAAGTIEINGSGGRVFGGVVASHLAVREIMG